MSSSFTSFFTSSFTSSCFCFSSRCFLNCS